MRDFTGGIMGLSGLSGTQGSGISQRPLSAGAPQAPAPATGGGLGNTMNTAAGMIKNGQTIAGGARSAYRGVGDLYGRIAGSGGGNTGTGLAAQSGKGLALPSGESPMPAANSSGVQSLMFHPPGGEAADPLSIGKLADAPKAPTGIGSGGIGTGGGAAGNGVNPPDNPAGNPVNPPDNPAGNPVEEGDPELGWEGLYAIGGRVPQYPAPAHGGSPPIGPALQAGKYAVNQLGSSGGASSGAAESSAASGAGAAAEGAAAGEGAATATGAGAGAAVTSAGASSISAASGAGAAAAEAAPALLALLARGGEVPGGVGSDPGQPTVGLVPGSDPGRADTVATTAYKGSYVIPADVVSALGQGNTLAGAKLLESHAASDLPPMDGGVRGANPAVPVKFSGGEFVFSPEQVAAFGGGDVRRGAAMLDQLVKTVREETAEQMQNMPPPK